MECPRCGKQMTIDKMYKALPTHGLSDEEVKLVHGRYATMVHCICGRHLLILSNGRVYYYQKIWQFLFYKKGIWKNPNWRIA